MKDVTGPPGAALGGGLGPVPLLLLRLLPVLREAHDVSVQGGGPGVQPSSRQGGHPHQMIMIMTVIMMRVIMRVRMPGAGA